MTSSQITNPSRTHASSSTTAAPAIHRLPRPTAARLRGALVVPTLASVLSELAQNALDAGARRIECWISTTVTPTLRVEDDGAGIAPADLACVGESNATSKPLGDMGSASSASYGFRGEALASIASLALVDVTSRVAGGESYAKIIKNSHTLYLGLAPGRGELARAHGTTVAVRELYNAVPVRRAAMAAASSSGAGSGGSVAACRRAIEALALVRPGVRWVLWEERSVGGPKRVLSLQGSRTSLDVFRVLYGSAGVHRVQSVRVSCAERRVDGFISLEGAVTKPHQHLYVNGYPLELSDLHLAISRRFANSQFSAMATDLMDDHHRHGGTAKRPSPRRLERHPVYVLTITLPAHEVDALYEPRKSVLGYRDAGSVQGFVVAVVDDFLRRQGFMPRSETAAESRNVSPRRGGQGRTVQSPRKRAMPEDEGSAPPSPSPVARKSKRRAVSEQPAPARRGGANGSGSGEGHETGVEWIRSLVKNLDDSVLPIRKSTPRSAEQDDGEDDSALEPEVDPFANLGATLPPAPSDISFSRESLGAARVLKQVDRKFIPCVLSGRRLRDPVDDDVDITAGALSQTPHAVLVVFDQHAADERAAVERLLDLLCDGFATDTMPTMHPAHETRIVLTQAEAEVLEAPGVRAVLGRWGIVLAAAESTDEGEPIDTAAGSDYAQVSVNAVPALLERLGSKRGTEMTRLLRLYLPTLADGGLGEVQALIASLEATAAAAAAAADEHDDFPAGATDGWARVQRWMPLEMLELANSKACRGAVMFEDKLDGDQAARLVARLAATRNPWVCAHGRPTFVPLCVVPEATRGKRKNGGRRQIDWAGWKSVADEVVEEDTV